jgi:hypothetical protein
MKLVMGIIFREINVNENEFTAHIIFENLNHLPLVLASTVKLHVSAPWHSGTRMLD